MEKPGYTGQGVLTGTLSNVLQIYTQMQERDTLSPRPTVFTIKTFRSFMTLCHSVCLLCLEYCDGGGDKATGSWVLLTRRK